MEVAKCSLLTSSQHVAGSQLGESNAILCQKETQQPLGRPSPPPPPSPLNLSSLFFSYYQGRVKHGFLSAPSLNPLHLLYLRRGLAVTEHSEVWRRIRRLSPKNNKRSWKKRQEFLGCDVRLFTRESSHCSPSSLHLRRVPTLFQPRCR